MKAVSREYLVDYIDRQGTRQGPLGICAKFGSILQQIALKGYYLFGKEIPRVL
jgi:hypothetical protein